MTDDAALVATTTYVRTTEVRAILDADDSLMGRFHRFLEEGRSPAEIAELEGNQCGPGIYVYTLPHYLNHCIDEETGKPPFKVGHSARDAYYRAGSAGLEVVDVTGVQLGTES